MKSTFYLSLLALIVFEFFRVYLVMPMPGSQELDSVIWAWWLHSSRWWIRAVAVVLCFMSFKTAFDTRRKWVPVLVMLITLLVVYVTNFVMSAESMFKPPHQLILSSAEKNSVDENAIIIGIAGKSESKAYPVRFIAYHHQVYDSIEGQPVLVTYCSVCRTGRVYKPEINGKIEGEMRLVGMTHYNAMFEDSATRSWWMQATGEAVTGPLRGQRMEEFPSSQMRLDKWLALHPGSKIMQPDPQSLAHYDSLARFERGESKSELTLRDTLSWQEKSWVAGVIANRNARAYDWNYLMESRIINDTLGNLPIALVVASDNISIAAFVRPTQEPLFITRDTLHSDSLFFDFLGNALSESTPRLSPLPVYQEYWHSWRHFHGPDHFYARSPGKNSP